MAQKVRIEGLRGLERNLARLTRATGRNTLKRALKIAAEPLASKARDIVAVDQGVLQRSITVSTKKPRNHEPGKQAYHEAKKAGADNAAARAAMRAARESNPGPFAEAFVGPGSRRKAKSAVPYAHMIEFGTVKSAAQPYMRPTWDAGKGPALARAVSEIEAQIDKAIARMEKKAARK